MKKSMKERMTLKPAPADSSYLPIAWEYREVIEEQIAKETWGKVVFFSAADGIGEAEGRAVELKDVSGAVLFLVLDNGTEVRADRIITLFGKPGAAFDEYQAYGNSCMDCTGGYDPDELG